MYKEFIILYLFVYSASAGIIVNYRNCTTGGPGPFEVQVTGCTTMPCEFVRGEDLVADIKFKSPTNAATIKPQVLVSIAGLTTPYPLPYPDACINLTYGGCPISQTEIVNYHLVMPILTSYPLISMTIKFRILSNEDSITGRNDPLVCVEVDGRVVD